MTPKFILKPLNWWRCRQIRKSIMSSSLYQPLLSCKHMVWNNGRIGLSSLSIEDPECRNAVLIDIRDRVISSGYDWSLDGIAEARLNGAITEKDCCTAIVNIGNDIKYL